MTALTRVNARRILRAIPRRLAARIRKPWTTDPLHADGIGVFVVPLANAADREMREGRSSGHCRCRLAGGNVKAPAGQHADSDR